MSRKNIITGTLILTCANLITKCMGFFYRVFMSNAIGAEGMGLYQLILPLYMLAWSITSAGFTTTISHLAAQEYIRGQNGNIGRIVKQAVCLSSVQVRLSAVSCFSARIASPFLCLGIGAPLFPCAFWHWLCRLWQQAPAFAASSSAYRKHSSLPFRRCWSKPSVS